MAEGDKQSAILRAEGERQAQVLRAEGFSNALKTIFGAAKGVDEKTMALQYLEALQGARRRSSSTKWIVPMELAELTRPHRRRHARGPRGGGPRPRADPGSHRMTSRPGRRVGVAAWLGRIAGALTLGYLGYVTRGGVAPHRQPRPTPVPPGGGPARDARRPGHRATRRSASRPMTG